MSGRRGAPARYSASARHASFSSVTGTADPFRQRARGPRLKRDVHGPVDPPRLWSIPRRAAEPHPQRPSRRATPPPRRRSPRSGDPGVQLGGAFAPMLDFAVGDDARQDLRPGPTSTPRNSLLSPVWRKVRNADAWRGSHGPSNVRSSRRKPYRVYRAAASRAMVPDDPATHARACGDGDARRDYRGPGRSSRNRLAWLELERLDRVVGTCPPFSSSSS